MDSYKGQKATPKYAWVIWNFTEERPQVWQANLTSFKTVQGYVLDEEWGDPVAYNLTIKREGTGTDTKYTITPSPNRQDFKAMVTKEQLEEVVAFDIFTAMKDKQLVSLAAAAEGEEVPEPESDGSGDAVITDFDASKDVNLDNIPF
jgi:hypothetical protein